MNTIIFFDMKFLYIKYSIIAVIIFGGSELLVSAQTIEGECYRLPVEMYNEEMISAVDSAELKTFRLTELDSSYYRQIAVALSYYPDLKETRIRFRRKKISTTMSCVPDLRTLFSKQRSYTVTINSREDFKGSLLSEVPYNAQIGVIAHELAHVTDYRKRNIGRMFLFGVNYLFKPWKRKREQEIDEITVIRGAGFQLRDWAQYSMFDSPKTTEKYKRFKRDIYLHPDEICARMQQMGCYKRRETKMGSEEN